MRLLYSLAAAAQAYSDYVSLISEDSDDCDVAVQAVLQQSFRLDASSGFNFTIIYNCSSFTLKVSSTFNICRFSRTVVTVI